MLMAAHYVVGKISRNKWIQPIDQKSLSYCISFLPEWSNRQLAISNFAPIKSVKIYSSNNQLDTGLRLHISPDLKSNRPIICSDSFQAEEYKIALPESASISQAFLCRDLASSLFTTLRIGHSQDLVMKPPSVNNQTLSICLAFGKGHRRDIKPQVRAYQVGKLESRPMVLSQARYGEKSCERYNWNLVGNHQRNQPAAGLPRASFTRSTQVSPSQLGVASKPPRPKHQER